jgi:zinc transport system substrate-binding protein
MLIVPIMPLIQAQDSVEQTSSTSMSNQSEASALFAPNATASKIPGASKLNVVASFYPILEFLKQIGGDRVAATSLIPTGIEPHDFEPTIQQIQNAEAAELVIYNGAGLEGSWIEQVDARNILDTSQGLNPTLASDTQQRLEAKNTSMESEEEGNQDVAAADPHIWLDPLLVKEQAEKIQDGLISVDPQNANYYSNNTAEFLAELDNLDTEIRTSLSDCNKVDFIAFHDSFSYFANRYGLNQHSITNALTPGGEVLPQRLHEVIELAKDLGITTVFAEDLIDPRSAEVVAEELPNGKVLILSPIEGVDREEQAAGIGYFDKMRENIANLEIGLECQS